MIRSLSEFTAQFSKYAFYFIYKLFLKNPDFKTLQKESTLSDLGCKPVQLCIVPASDTHFQPEQHVLFHLKLLVV